MKALFPTISSTCHKELPREDSCPSNTSNLTVPPLQGEEQQSVQQSYAPKSPFGRILTLQREVFEA